MSDWRTKQQSGLGRGAWRARGGNPIRRGNPQNGQPVNAAPARMKMEYVASVSRSSGLEKDGDTLKDFKFQEEYREFIKEKDLMFQLNDVFRMHPLRPSESEVESKSRISAQENVMILFRKLREGVSSSRRNDTFALEVYETSLYLTAIFDLPRQTTSIIPHLLPELYRSTPPPHPHRLLTVLVSLLHHLIAAYPSQGTYDQLLDSIPNTFFLKSSEARIWLASVASSLRTHNYTKFEQLTQRSSTLRLFDDAEGLDASLSSLSISSQSSGKLAKRALLSLVDSLRKKARETSWSIIRSAYRELSCNSTSETNAWLSRSLHLQSVVADELSTEPDCWLEQHIPSGHVRRKEEVEGRWIVCKIC